MAVSAMLHHFWAILYCQLWPVYLSGCTVFFHIIS